MSLETPRLRLLPCAPQHLLALIDQPERLEQVLGLPAADGLHGFYVSDDVSPAWLAALRSSSSPDPWRHGFFVVHRAAASVIGSAGFKSPPDPEGVVEVAYGTCPAFRGAAMRPRRPLRWSRLRSPVDRLGWFGRTPCRRRMLPPACF